MRTNLLALLVIATLVAGCGIGDLVQADCYAVENSASNCARSSGVRAV